MLKSIPLPAFKREPTFVPNKLNERSRNQNSTLTRSSSSSSFSASISQKDDSIHNVPSLFNATCPDKTNGLAFTSEDLQITRKHSASSGGAPPGSMTMVMHQHPITPSPNPGSMKSNKKRFVRHGLMIATTSELLDSINFKLDSDPSIRGASADAAKSLTGTPNMNSNPGTSSIPLRARPTVTTILRQQHVLEKAEKKEKDKLDTLMVSNVPILDVDSISKEHEKKQADEAKAAESKRLLQARLAYERAVAASRKMIDKKQKIAESTRQKEKEWQSILEKQREIERERRRAMTESLQRANCDSKRAFDEMHRAKQLKAIKVKQEIEQLQAEARLKKQEEVVRRQDKIQQIQAAKLALKRTKETMGNPNQFYRSIAIPETQIKLRLQKEEEKRKLQETRRKIQAEKQMKSVKLIRAMKKIQSCESLGKKQQQKHEQQFQPQQERPLSSSINSRPFTLDSFSYLRRGTTTNNLNAKSGATQPVTKDSEIDKMVQQLKQLKTENFQQRLKEKQQRVEAATGTYYIGSRSTVKVIGTNLTRNRSKANNDTNSLKNADTFYRHRSHYGIHV